MIDLEKKIAIITGASSGIGAALAKELSDRGAKVAIAARRREKLQNAAECCSGETLVVETDITKRQDRERLIQETLQRWQRIDILINNAGLGMYGHFSNTTEEDWRRIFEVNLFAPVFLTQAVIPVMQKQGQGIVVNVASVGGLIAHSDNVTPYVSTKHAVIGFSRGLRKDLAGTGIRILAACPHLTDTEFFTTSPGAEQMASEVEKYKDFMDTPEDVANGILGQMDSENLVIFPTAKPAKAYQKQRDL